MCMQGGKNYIIFIMFEYETVRQEGQRFVSTGFCVVCCLPILCRLPSCVPIYMVDGICGCLTHINLSAQGLVVCKVELYLCCFRRSMWFGLVCVKLLCLNFLLHL